MPGLHRGHDDVEMSAEIDCMACLALVGIVKHAPWIKVQCRGLTHAIRLEGEDGMDTSLLCEASMAVRLLWGP